MVLRTLIQGFKALVLKIMFVNSEENFLMDQLLPENVPLKYLLSQDTLFVASGRSIFKEVNDLDLYLGIRYLILFSCTNI